MIDDLNVTKNNVCVWRRSIQSSSLEAGLSSEKALKLPCRWQALFVKETSSVWHRNCKRHQQVCEAPNVTWKRWLLRFLQIYRAAYPPSHRLQAAPPGIFRPCRALSSSRPKGLICWACLRTASKRSPHLKGRLGSMRWARRAGITDRLGRLYPLCGGSGSSWLHPAWHIGPRLHLSV